MLYIEYYDAYNFFGNCVFGLRIHLHGHVLNDFCSVDILKRYVNQCVVSGLSIYLGGKTLEL
jgi:hypothetical protein